MTINLQVGDTLPPLKHTATPFQLFRYSAVTWNPHRIHFDEPYAREEGHDGVALHSHLRAGLALRCLTEGLGDGWHVIEQQAYADTDDTDRIQHLSLLCSGYCPERAND